MSKEIQTKYLKDYVQPNFWIDEVVLNFELSDTQTIVDSELHVVRNGNHKLPLVLHGEELELLSLTLNVRQLTSQQYSIDDKTLTIPEVPDMFVLHIKVAIYPQNNTRLEGLYKSNGIFCTQCEPEGFRRITYFVDRPDNMARFTTTIIADKSLYPVLLANGNIVASGDYDNGRHWAKWVDPSLKPSYLFALVAGDLEFLHGTHTTQSGRKIDLYVYAEKGFKNRCKYALESLKRAMLWDEQSFGLEYDLDMYMVVAVSDFNVGAMENKGLNIFNARCVFADAATATDRDYLYVENVVGHEYFHNWTGNRITCRDWFQLTLKEGLTMFRDQQFSAAMHDAAIKRIQDVNIIRTRQFAEDAGPMSHPVQPQSYVEINNFYTSTVYCKGAEIIRMLHTILGPKLFLKGMKLYVKRHDGSAVTVYDFVQAMQDASGIDCTKFKRWYTEAGTPMLKVEGVYDANNHTYKLRIKQDMNLHIPISIALFNVKGKEMLLRLKEQAGKRASRNMVLNLKSRSHLYEFVGVKEKPVPSLLRNFSAPVKLNYNYSYEDLALLVRHDTDGFNRWDAMRNFVLRVFNGLVAKQQQGLSLVLDDLYFDLFKYIILDSKVSLSLKAELLALPDISYLIQNLDVLDLDALEIVYNFVRCEIGKRMGVELLAEYVKQLRSKPKQLSPNAIGQRSVKNCCLHYLMCEPNSEMLGLCMQQFRGSENMTDVIGALRAINDLSIHERELMFAEFYQRWHKDDLVINKWLESQALSLLPNALENVISLSQQEVFNINNPNKAYALLRTFAMLNPLRFHTKSGAGYEFIADQVLALDNFNPHVAAAIVEPLIHWRKYDAVRSEKMQQQLRRILKTPKLSPNVFELVNKSLEG